MKTIQNIQLETCIAHQVTSIGVALADRIELPRSASGTILNQKYHDDTDRIDAVLWASSWYAFELAFLLIEEGKLDLEAKLSEILPFLKFNDHSESDISVRDVLTQSSMLPNAFRYGFFTSKPDRNFLKYFVKGSQSFRRNPRNAKLNPVDLTLLELILEAVTGESYTHLFESRIVIPHGFSQTFLTNQPHDVNTNLKIGKQHFTFNALAFAGIIASAKELAIFALHFQKTVALFESKYNLQTSVWFNGFSADDSSNYLYVTYQGLHSFILLGSEGKAYVGAAQSKNDLLEMFLDNAYQNGIHSRSYRDRIGSFSVEDRNEGIFAGKGKRLTLDQIEDAKLIKVGSNVYAIYHQTTREGIRFERCELQKVDSIPTITWWHSAESGSILTKIHPGEDLGSLEWLLLPKFIKEAPSTMFCGPVYHVVDSHLALPAIDLPSNWDNDTEELRHEIGGITAGLHEYSPISKIIPDLSHLHMEEGKIVWTRSRRNLDTIRLVSTVVMIAINANGELVFDSRKNKGLPSFDEEIFYGFFGKKDGEVDLNWEEISSDVA